MGSVVPTYGLVSFNCSIESDELAALRTKLSQTNELFNTFSAAISDMFRALDVYNATVLADLNALNAEITRIQNKMQEEAIRNRQYFHSTEPHTDFDESTYSYGSDEIFMPVDQVREDPEVVALFRKIASKTHPDKTSDSRLHALFIKAKELRKQGNLDGLKWVLQQVESPDAAKEYEYAQALAALAQAVREAEASLADLRRSSEYELWTWYVKSPSAVKHRSNDQLRERCASLRAHLEVLRKASGEPEPRPNMFSSFFIRG